MRVDFSHLPDHDFELADAVVVDLAEVIHLDNGVFLKDSDGGCAFGLHNEVIREDVVAGESAIYKMNPIRYSYTALISDYIISLSLS